jgi:hypothetical protein
MHYRTGLVKQATQVLCVGPLRTWSGGPPNRTDETQTIEPKSFLSQLSSI